MLSCKVPPRYMGYLQLGESCTKPSNSTDCYAAAKTAVASVGGVFDESRDSGQPAGRADDVDSQLIPAGCSVKKPAAMGSTCGLVLGSTMYRAMWNKDSGAINNGCHLPICASGGTSSPTAAPPTAPPTAAPTASPTACDACKHGNGTYFCDQLGSSHWHIMAL